MVLPSFTTILCFPCSAFGGGFRPVVLLCNEQHAAVDFAVAVERQLAPYSLPVNVAANPARELGLHVAALICQLFRIVRLGGVMDEIRVFPCAFDVVQVVAVFRHGFQLFRVLVLQALQALRDVV